MDNPWYITLFKNYARHYDAEPFTQGTVAECDFIERELQFDKQLKILDVGCGTGRHAIELTGRGYQITGIDLSEAQLARAREKTAEAGLCIDFIQADARNLPFTGQFDVAIMLCEGAFPLMETDEENEAILSSVAKALKDTGKFIFTTLNGLYPLRHSLDDFHETAGEGVSETWSSKGFDVLTMRDHSRVRFIDDTMETHTITSNERYYIPSEISAMLKRLGFIQIEFCGAYNRGSQLTDEDFEMLVIAKKHVTNQSLVSSYTGALEQHHLGRAYRVIMDVLKHLQRELTQALAQAKTTDVYQGYLDMSYVGVTTPLLQSRDLKFAIVYEHASGNFLAWLSAKNRTIQDRYRLYLRSRVPSSFTLVEKGPGVDAIMEAVLLANADFDRQDELVSTLVDKSIRALHAIHLALEDPHDGSVSSC